MKHPQNDPLLRGTRLYKDYAIFISRINNPESFPRNPQPTQQEKERFIHYLGCRNTDECKECIKLRNDFFEPKQEAA